MFKRVEKRRRKREEEEELGLDEDMKEVLGMHDTDSEESASDSDDSSDDGAGGSDDEGGVLETGAFADDLDDVEDESEAEEEEEEEEEQPVITVQEALRDALYIVSLEPVVKACIVCPGKLLKGAKMVELHRTSNAHERRVKLFKTLASKANPKENAWDLLREHAEKKPTPSLAEPSDDSKRAQKRKAHAALRKERRDKQKAKTRAKKAKAVDPSAPEPQTVVPQPTKPPQKKQKVATSSPAPHLPTRSPPAQASASIKSIARSASDRAKMARARTGNGKPKRTPKVAVS